MSLIVDRVQFPAKLVDEDVQVQFNFASRLAGGETITSQLVSATTWGGNDATPAGIISGAASASGSVVTQKIIDGRAGVTYQLLCHVTTSAGQALEMRGFLVVLSKHFA